MKTYIDLTKGIAFGSGKAHEFKSKSLSDVSDTTSLGFDTSFPSEVSQSSRQQSSKEPCPHQRNAAENPNQGSAKRMSVMVTDTKTTSNEFPFLHPSQESHFSPRNLLHQICEELGVYHYGY